MKNLKIKQIIALLIISTIIIGGGITIYKSIKETRELKEYKLTQVEDNQVLTKESVIVAIKNVNKLEILEKDFTKTYKIKEDGFMSNKSKDITVEGIASYYIDLANINENNIIVSSTTNKIELYISNPIAKIEFTNKLYGETEKSLFAFSDIEMTSEQYDRIENTIKNEIMSEMNTNMNEANDRVQGAIKEVLETLTKQNYKVEVNFVG